MTNDFPKFIVVDGPDGSGKTTIIERLVKYIETIKPELKVVVGRGLGSGKAAESIRSTMMNNEIKKSSNYEIYGAIMCLIDCHETFVLPNINNNKLVILDRYIPSYYAYQVKARNSEIASKMLIDCFAAPFTIQPDVYINTYCSIENSIDRMKNRNDNNYLDEEGIIFKRKLLEGYEEFFNKAPLMFCASKPSKIFKVNTDKPLADVLSEVYEITSKIFTDKPVWLD